MESIRAGSGCRSVLAGERSGPRWSIIRDSLRRIPSTLVLATPPTAHGRSLRAFRLGMRQEQLTEHAEEAGRLGKDLYERMAVLTEHLNDVGQALGKSILSYNKAVGSLETRILPAARRFKELGVSSEKEIPMLGPVELVSRKALPYDSE